jgi:hypothetical protein
VKGYDFRNGWSYFALPIQTPKQGKDVNDTGTSPKRRTFVSRTSSDIGTNYLRVLWTICGDGHLVTRLEIRPDEF